MRVSTIVGTGLALATMVAAWPGNACEFAISEAMPGLLSRTRYDSPPMPRNVAFVWRQIPNEEPLPEDPFVVAENAESHETVLGSALLGPTGEGSYLVRPTSPLEPNTQYLYYTYGSPSAAFQTADYLDESPPERPEIANGSISFDDGTEGCAESSCGDVTSLQFELTRKVSDDHAREDDLVYALYLAETASEVRSMSTPTALLTSFSLILDDGWANRDAFIAVSALDYAGNESARSEPLQVNAGVREGCAIRSRSGRPSWGLLGVLAALGLLRRARRRQASASTDAAA